MNRLIYVALILGVLGLGPASAMRAHEGHTHSVMGTVLKVSPGQLEIQTKDGKVETVVLTHKTVVTRDKAPAKVADVAVGNRVVIDVGAGTKPLTAVGIKLGAGAAAKPKS